MKDLLQNRASKMVYINADSRAKYQEKSRMWSITCAPEASMKSVCSPNRRSTIRKVLTKVMKKGGGEL